MNRSKSSYVTFKSCLVVCIAVAAVALFLGFEVLVYELGELERRFNEVIPPVFTDNIKDPVILWWTPFTQNQGSLKSCGMHQCFFTVNRKYRHHPQLKAFLFYGSDLDVGDLPVPRLHDQQWGLLHEESPKNNRFIFCHEEIMTLFNHTSTFKRQSDCPITTQYLDSIRTLESKQYLLSVDEKNRLMRDEELAMISYVQSDCGTPSDRDTFVQMLQRHLKVDSYGQCLHNKDLPKHLTNPIGGMDHSDFYHITAKYKFTLALENAVCDDYITEKFWRPFIAGSVPIVYGSPKIKDWLPDNHSAIVVNDFSDIKELVQLLLQLNSSNTEYEKYLKFKSQGVTNNHLLRTMTDRKWAINDYTKPNFVTQFECCVCKRLHQQKENAKKGLELKHQATIHHYGCPKPTHFSNDPEGNLEQLDGGEWNQEWISGHHRARAVAKLLSGNRTFSRYDIDKMAYELQYL